MDESNQHPTNTHPDNLGTQTAPANYDFILQKELPNPSPQKSKRKKLVILIILITCVLLVALVVTSVIKFRTERAEQKRAQNLTTSLKNYPAAYVSAGLPQYPKATVNLIVRPDASINDGPIQFFIATDDNMQSITDFYDKALLAAGWKLTSNTTNEDGDSVLVYAKDAQQYSLTIGTNLHQEEGIAGETLAVVDWRSTTN